MIAAVDGGTGTKTRRVVLIDDAADLRRLVGVVLERSGRFEVVGEAANGLDGIELVANTDPDVVLLDLSMPVMDGLEALPRILDRAPESRVVILSGYSERAAAGPALRAGAVGYLEKGLSPDRLLEELDRLLSGDAETSDDEAEAITTFTPPPDLLVDPNTVLGQLAHDLRSPILTAQGYVQILANSLPEATDERDMAGRASAALARLETLIADALAYARADAASLALVEVDLESLIHTVVADLPGSGRVRIRSATSATGVADRSALERVLRNLLDNALTYSDGEVTVELSELDEDRVLVSVHDRGPGIEAERGQDLFRPFVRGAAGSSTAGSGLGLAACARIVQQLEGRIWGENRDGGGASFHVALRRPGTHRVF